MKSVFVGRLGSPFFMYSSLRTQHASSLSAKKVLEIFLVLLSYVRRFKNLNNSPKLITSCYHLLDGYVQNCKIGRVCADKFKVCIQFSNQRNELIDRRMMVASYYLRREIYVL